MTEEKFDALLKEDRIFTPSDEFTRAAIAKDKGIYDRAGADRLAFWAEEAGNLDWFRQWDKVLVENEAPFYRWFEGGKLNASYNCIDRHLKTSLCNANALLFEGEPGDRKAYTYLDLYREVNKFAAVLKTLGVGKGDKVTIYMPMIPEAVFAMLACARIGAVHSVVFGGFSASALNQRIEDAEAKLLITTDGSYRRGKVIPLKEAADEALNQGCSCLEKVLVVKRTGTNVHMKAGRDVWYHEAASRVDAGTVVEPEEMDAEDPLFILYSSGTTGRPKGILHTTGGYMVGVNTTFRYVFDYKPEDLFWCTADIGWITGHSYIVYGPLSAGAAILIYEGTPDYPERDRFWEIVEHYKVTILYTAPTAIRTFMRWGAEYPSRHNLTSLRLLGTVGEPINPEAWVWYHEHIGGGRCPIVDTWWQTETGAIMITPLPGVTPLKPGSATHSFPGIEVDVVDEQGNSVPEGGGYLVVKSPWPAMLRTLYKDPERYLQTYWGTYEGMYFTGDGAKRDSDGYIWVIGRVDDVINVAGHRIGTMEVESALVDHPAVAEAAVIGRSHDVKGQAISAFVTLKEGYEGSEELIKELKSHVAKLIGAIARPEEIFFTGELPKTRSGKIMRRLLRDVAEGRVLGDTTTLTDPTVIEQIKQRYA